MREACKKRLLNTKGKRGRVNRGVAHALCEKYTYFYALTVCCYNQLYLVILKVDIKPEVKCLKWQILYAVLTTT